MSLLGKLLRIDVGVPDADPEGYDVPADNLFLDGLPVAALPEIWAFGVRNPWRLSFDAPALGGTDAMVIGDVGQQSWEEINYEPANRGGRNYGWRNREGAHDNITSQPLAYGPATDPVFEYGRGDGQTVSGGFVYRGTAPGESFYGRYFFADYVQGPTLVIRSVCKYDDPGGHCHRSRRAHGGSDAFRWCCDRSSQS